MRPSFKALRAFVVDDLTQTIYWRTPTKPNHTSLVNLQIAYNSSIVPPSNDGATVHPQIQILPFYIIFSLLTVGVVSLS